MEYEISSPGVGASKKDISDCEKSFGASFPRTLIEILQKHNGAVYWADPKEVQFLGTADMLEYFDSYSFTECAQDAIPFAMDGSGNFLTFRKDHGEAVFFMSSGNLGWDDAVKVAHSFNEFLEDPLPAEYVPPLS